MRGNVKEFFVNSASQAPVYLQLFALPSTGSNNFIATLLLGVTNNMTNGGALTNIVPNMVVSNVTGVGKATLISGPTPSSYPILNNGAETFFQWNYNINGSNGYTVISKHHFKMVISITLSRKMLYWVQQLLWNCGII